MGVESRKAWVTGPLIVIGLFVIMSLSCGRAGATPDPEWSTETVDNEGVVGWFTSIALDSSNRPHISYSDLENFDLKYARWTGSSWFIQTVDSAENVGWHTSIALDENGNPHISYQDYWNKNLKYARWTGSSWSIEIVDSTGSLIEYTSIALDENGRPHISYSDLENFDLKYARWTGDNWSIENVDFEESVGVYNSIALDSSGYPHISYYDLTNYDLKYAHWTGENWSIQTVDTDVGMHTSIALDENGNPHISYHDWKNYDLKYARWTGSSWSIQTIDSTGDVGEYTSIVLDSSARAHISYCDGTNYDTKYARWTGSSWKIETVDNVDNVGTYTSIALDDNSYPHISYYDSTNGDLKHAYRINSLPALTSTTVVPSISPASMTFTYEAIFTDEDNDPPAYIRVYVDNDSHEMAEEDPADDDVTNGKMYKYAWATTTDNIGSHGYYFEASDGFDNVRAPSEDNYSGPTVEKLLTTLAVSPSSFAVKTTGDKSLTATLTSDGTPLQNKTITWSASQGSVSPSTGYTDSDGRMTVTYTAPDNETTVTVTASFAGDSAYQAGSVGSEGTVAQFVAVLTFSRPDGTPWRGLEVHYRFAGDGADNYLGATDGQGQITLTDSIFAGKQVHFRSADGEYSGAANISSAGGDVSVVLSPGFEISSAIIVVLVLVTVAVALVVMYAKGRKWWEKTKKPPEIPAIK